jgi:hypothetical protein
MLQITPSYCLSHTVPVESNVSYSKCVFKLDVVWQITIQSIYERYTRVSKVTVIITYLLHTPLLHKLNLYYVSFTTPLHHKLKLYYVSFTHILTSQTEPLLRIFYTHPYFTNWTFITYLLHTPLLHKLNLYWRNQDSVCEVRVCVKAFEIHCRLLLNIDNLNTSVVVYIKGDAA